MLLEKKKKMFIYLPEYFENSVSLSNTSNFDIQDLFLFSDACFFT